MARSHVCLGCGLDLARRSAPPDPHYGLPVVVCPGCGLASVRRPRAGAARWQNTVRVWDTVRGMGLRLVLLWALVVATVHATSGLGEGLRYCVGGNAVRSLLEPGSQAQARMTSWLDIEGRWVLGEWVLAWSAAGGLLGLAFPHWRVRWWLVAWVVCPALLLGVFAPAIALHDWGSTPVSFERALRGRLPTLGARFVLPPLGGGLILATALMPTGRRLAIRLAPRKGLYSRQLKRCRRRRRTA